MSRAAEDRRLRGLRPARNRVDPWRPLAVAREWERQPRGRSTPGLTVFLAGRECPFTCVFCDLWRYTLEGPTPPGATVAQLEIALRQTAPAAVHWIKLYNASNFFDRRAVPPEDHPRLLELLAPFDRVVVECHPSLVGDDCLSFSEALEGRLEVAMGLETIHPEVLPRLNKGMDLDGFAAACSRLQRAAIGIRAFVLVGTPWIAEDEVEEWAVRSVGWALDHGVETVALIPLRAGNGEMERLAERGEWRPPTLSRFEAAFDRSLELAGEAVVLADLWDFDRLARCDACREDRRRRLERLNATGVGEAALGCPVCGTSEVDRAAAAKGAVG